MTHDKYVRRLTVHQTQASPRASTKTEHLIPCLICLKLVSIYCLTGLDIKTFYKTLTDYADNTGQQNLTVFFVPRGKISNSDRTFNAQFKYVSSFSPSPTVFFCDSQVKCEKMCIFTYFTGQQNLTFFWHTGGKYLFLIELLTLNSNM
jgi:hypothetical protein